MIRFIVRRVLAAILTLLVVATMTFFLMNLIPGGPFATERATAKQIEALEAKYGLNQPLFQQYLQYMGRVIRFDLGDSFKRMGFSVNSIISEKFPVSAS